MPGWAASWKTQGKYKHLLPPYSYYGGGAAPISPRGGTGHIPDSSTPQGNTQRPITIHINGL